MVEEEVTHVDVKAIQMRELKAAVKSLVEAECNLLAAREFQEDYCAEYEIGEKIKQVEDMVVSIRGLVVKLDQDIAKEIKNESI